jgi:2-polyprenyl-3-methyl-5-hydroxy-6-metoxy-1,4-benzoquinol methylase
VAGTDKLHRFFELQRVYASLYDSYVTRGVSRTLDPDDKENRFEEEWHVDHYFSVGADVLRILVAALIQDLREPPQTILDFPSGSGRVTRHLRAFFPDARIVACDLYESHLDFCVREFGAESIVSKENFDEIDFGLRFDLIFCGSLLTHLPEDLFRSVFRLISRSLTDRGLAVITLHGRHSEFFQKYKSKYLSDDLFAIAESAVADSGFGYVDYGHPLRATFNRQARYGISVAYPHWTLKLVEADYGIRVLGYAERSWDDHHDVLVIGKPALNQNFV